MFLRFDAAMNGKNFSDIAPEVLLRDIIELPVEMDTDATNRAGRYGQTVPTLARRSLSVRLVYQIREYDIQRRSAVNGMVLAWAMQGGWLTINSRPGKRLRVVCNSLPGMDSNLKWTQDLSITFTAYAVPYWEDDGDAKSVTFTTEGDAVDGMYHGANVINAPGNVDKEPVTAFVTNINSDGALLTHLKIMVDDTFMEFEGMNQGADGYMGAFIVIDYDENDILRIRDTRSDVDNGSLLKYRTEESDDDLLAVCNKDNQIHVYADVPVSLTIYARGRWL